ncbi:MAG TPA: hypothetical protein VF456_24120 [Vicinamibacterales bacterium]
MRIYVADASTGLLTEATLVVISRKPQAIDINRAPTNRDIGGQLFAEHDQIVLVSQQRLSPVQGADIPSYTRIALFDETQRVPQRFHFLTPGVEGCGRLFFLCALHLSATTLMCRSNPTSQGAHPAVIRPPTLCIPVNRSKFPIDGLPRLLSSNRLARSALSGGQSPARAGERLLAHQVRMLRPEFCQGLHQDVRVTEVGQRAIDRTQRSLIPVQPAALVIVNELKDRPDFLHALSCFVNGLLVRRSSAVKLAPCCVDLFPREAAQPVRY